MVCRGFTLSITGVTKLLTAGSFWAYTASGELTNIECGPPMPLLEVVPLSPPSPKVRSLSPLSHSFSLLGGYGRPCTHLESTHNDSLTAVWVVRWWYPKVK